MKRIAGGAETNYRTTDHSGEIAWLRLQGVTEPDRLRALAYLVAADLLQGHDETGLSLDEWEAPRELVELMLGHPVLDNGA